MKPQIDTTKFGSITIGGKTYDYDVLIRLEGKVEKRKKKLSKQVYGSSHKISQAEAEYVIEKGAKRLIIGSGQSGMVSLSEEAASYLQEKGLKVDILPTPHAIKAWNEAHGAVIALFHITC